VPSALSKVDVSSSFTCPRILDFLEVSQILIRVVICKRERDKFFTLHGKI
jgi:hypothetical protein